MKIKITNQNPHKAEEVDFEVPDDTWTRNGALWGMAVFDVLDTIEGRLRNYTYGSYIHIRKFVHPAIDGSFIKLVIKSMAEKGIIKLDNSGNVVAISSEWKAEIMQ